MSLKPTPIQPVPERTARVAKAAFRKGNPLLKLRDELGAIFADEDFADLFPKLGQPGLPPWRLALVTLLQFREDLPDRRAAEAVRARIDWKYLLGLELDDPGFDHSVLCEFRARLLEGGAEERSPARAAGGVPGARAGQGARPATQRHHPRAGRHPHAQPPRAGRRDPACRAERAGHRRAGLAARGGAEGLVRALRPPGRGRPPAAERRRTRGLRAPVGEDGFALLDRLDEPATPEELRGLPKVLILRQVWARHFVREGGAPPRRRRAAQGQGRAAPARDRAGRVPYDTQARFRTRSGICWTGYVVHLTETCDDDAVHLMTHAMTTVATVHEARCTAAIHAALAGKGLVPAEHLADAAYVDAELLVRSREDHGIDLVGPPRGNPSWQAKVEGGHTLDRFEVDWDASGSAARRASSPRPGARRSTTPARPTSR